LVCRRTTQNEVPAILVGVAKRMYNSHMSEVETRLKKIISLLSAEYGEREWRLKKDPVSVLVQTILSQNTSDTNSDRAFESLRNRFSSWKKVADASIDTLAESIKQGGLSQVKARYIKEALGKIILERGNTDLTFLKNLDPKDARDWLMKLPGVGQKTANCVLLFSIGMPVLPVDTHVFRVTKRLGLIDSDTKIEDVPEKLEGKIPSKLVYAFHVLVIEHGRRICIARFPRCRICVLGNICPSFALFTEPSGQSPKLQPSRRPGRQL
jgi:endonuclease III